MFPSANDVIDLCSILYNKTRIVATFFFQRMTAAFELFFYRMYLHFRYLVLEKQKLKLRASLTDIWQLVIYNCVIFAYIISRQDGENNGFLAGVSFPPSSHAPRVSLEP